MAHNKEAARMAGLVSLEFRGDVALIGLDRPAKRNAISDALLAELDAHVGTAQAAGARHRDPCHGPCFSAGLDLGEHRARQPAEVFDHSRGWHRVFPPHPHRRVPAIAANPRRLRRRRAGTRRRPATSASRTRPPSSPCPRHARHLRRRRRQRACRAPDRCRADDRHDAAPEGRSTPRRRSARAWSPTSRPPAAAPRRPRRSRKRWPRMAPLTVMGVLQALPRIQDMGEEDGLFVEKHDGGPAQSGRKPRRLQAFVEGRAPKAGEA
jgi:hypothetical protein